MTLFCVKRFVIAIVTASLRDPLSIPALVYINLSLFTIGYTLNNKPLERKSNNLIEITNEFFIFTTGYFLMIFSEWIYNPEASEDGDYSHDPVTIYNFGYCYLTIIIIILSVNLSYVFTEFLKSARKAYRKHIYYKKWGTYFKIMIFNHVKREDLKKLIK